MSSHSSRRKFLKGVGLASGGLMVPVGAPLAHAAASDDPVPLHKPIGEGRTICPYCSVGCGLAVATNEAGHIINVEGDTEHPINRGSLDPKSAALAQLANSPLRLKKVKYRAPNATEWEDKSWDWAVEQIAQRIKETRDKTFTRTVQVDGRDVTVNRTEAIAWLGGASCSNEEGYLATKFSRSLGIVWLEHQARI